MARFLYPIYPDNQRRKHFAVLAFCWMLGLFSVFRLVLLCEDPFFTLISRVQTCRVSFGGLCGVLLIPFLISVFAITRRRLWVLPFVAFCRAFLLGFCILGIWQIYPNGGWLAVLTILFSSLMGNVVLWLFWLRGSPRWIWAYGLTLVLIGCADMTLISPFLTNF